MRQIIAILLSLSLSWVTTGYACEGGMARMTQHCCQPGQDNHCPAPGQSQSGKAKSGSTCCQSVACVDVQADTAATADSSFVKQFQPLAPPPSLDIQTISPNPYQSVALVSPIDLLPSWGTQTYLQTARLRI